MNTPESHALRAVLRTVLLFCASAVCAGETIVSENFESLDLTKLPQGWRVSTPDEVSIVQDPGGSKVLRIAHKGEGMAELNIPIDAKLVRGRTMTVTVRMKCPNGYTAVREKQGMPQLMTVYESGGRRPIRYGGPPATARGWVRMRSPNPIPADASGVAVSLRVKWVACEAFFDDLVVTVDGAPATVANGTKPSTGATQSTPKASRSSGPGASVKQLYVEQHGARMGPEVLAAMRALRRPGATASTYAVIGPAAPLKELGKTTSVKGWRRLTPPRELAGPAATPEALFLSLPAYLADKKPEAVILACGDIKDRKASYKEQHDWNDLARLCLRLGALPVLAIPPQDVDCPSRMEMLQAVRLSNLPAVEVSPEDGGERVSIAEGAVPAPFPQRVGWMFRNLEQHVCGRKPAKEPTESAGPEDEEE